MKRRTYLRSVTALGAAGAAGCLGLGDSNPNVVLSEPDRQYESSDVPYPAWGEQLPDVSLPAPLEDREVALRGVEKPRLLTFFYSNCNTVCPVLISTLRNVQTHALNNGYGDGVAFFPMTFDPARDDADRLRTYAGQMNVDLDAGDWHFLRPGSESRAKQVYEEQFGFKYQRQSADEHGHGDGYMFTHMPLILLVNGDDYVERAYTAKQPDPERIIADLKRVRNA